VHLTINRRILWELRKQYQLLTIEVAPYAKVKTLKAVAKVDGLMTACSNFQVFCITGYAEENRKTKLTIKTMITTMVVASKPIQLFN
jgi:hypothetical protein